MKRFLLGITILGTTAVLAGCPIYSDGGSYRVCTSSGCFDCPDPSLSSACIVWQCTSSGDCEQGFTCEGNSCVAAEVADAEPSTGSKCSSPAQCAGGWVCGQDGTCHSGSCETWGCPSGYGCFFSVSTDLAQCVLGTSAADASSTPDSASAVDAGRESATGTSEGGDATSAAPATACNADGQCGGGGARCIDGQCTPQSELCSDGTQCSSGEACVNGVCTPRCAASAPCPIGFACDLTLGVCSLDPTVCASNGDCQGGTVCVESYCVAPCAAADAGPSCPAGDLCVNGGCIPDQAATFTCKNDGYAGAVANTCDAASICLHGDCYVECDLDGGECAASGTVCKQVTTAQGTFAVCAPPSELGSQCDPAAGTYCGSGAPCIDGTCN